MRTLLVLTLLMGSVSMAHAQRVARHTSASGSVYPDVSLTNLVGMYDMTLTDWERNLKLISKLRDDFGDGGISYTIEPKSGSADGMCFITKKTDAIELVYTIGTNSTSIFTDFLKEIKPNYVQDADGYQIYSWESFTKVKYVFAVKITTEQEYVRVYVSQ